MTIERNAPCPCGSGRKYKKCCLPSAAVSAIDWEDVRDRLITRLLHVATSHLDEDSFDDALDEYMPHAHDMTEDRARLSILPWIAFHWRPDEEVAAASRLRAGESLAERALRVDRDLSAPERRLLELIAREPASWWLLEAASGGNVRLVDLLRHEERLCSWQALGEKPAHFVYARIVTVDGQAVATEMLLPIPESSDVVARAERFLEQLEAPAHVEPAWLRQRESLVRLSYLRASFVGQKGPEPPLAFAFVQAPDLDAVLARLTTGLEHDVAAARRALADGCLRWRFVSEPGGLPERDGAWLVRRGDLLELRALDFTDSFDPVREAVEKQLEGSGARVLSAEEALGGILDRIVPEADPPPERALLARLIRGYRQLWGDVGFARRVTERAGPAGLLLPVPEMLAFRSFCAMTEEVTRVLAGDPLPAGWRLTDTMASFARREGGLSADDAALLDAMWDTPPRPWLVVELLDARRARVSDMWVDEAPIIEAQLPPDAELAPGDVFGGRLMGSEDAARFIEAVRLDAEHVTEMLETGRILFGSTAWLDDEGHEAAYLRYFEWDTCIEVYAVGDAEAVLATWDPEAGSVEGEDMYVMDWDVDRDASGALVRATAEVFGEVDGMDCYGLIALSGGNLRLSSDDPEALSEWRDVLARVLPPRTSLTWLRQERDAVPETDEEE